MGSFNELPSDVRWLILRKVILHELRLVWEFPIQLFEGGGGYPIRFNNNRDFVDGALTHITSMLAMVSKSFLSLIKRKTFRFNKRSWLFVKGAITTPTA
jgi:hypothetical protein